MDTAEVAAVERRVQWRRTDRTIRDFGEQWSHYGENEGFYGSLDLLQDMFGPLLATNELRGARVADIGSGTGRIVRMLAAAGAEHVVAVEPSVGVEVLRENVRDLGDRVEVLHATGEDSPGGSRLRFRGLDRGDPVHRGPAADPRGRVRVRCGRVAAC